MEASLDEDGSFANVRAVLSRINEKRSDIRQCFEDEQREGSFSLGKYAVSPWEKVGEVAQVNGYSVETHPPEYPGVCALAEAWKSDSATCTWKTLTRDVPHKWIVDSAKKAGLLGLFNGTRRTAHIPDPVVTWCKQSTAFRILRLLLLCTVARGVQRGGTSFRRWEAVLKRKLEMGFIVESEVAAGTVCALCLISRSLDALVIARSVHDGEESLQFPVCRACKTIAIDLNAVRDFSELMVACGKKKKAEVMAMNVWKRMQRLHETFTTGSVFGFKEATMANLRLTDPHSFVHDLCIVSPKHRPELFVLGEDLSIFDGDGGIGTDEEEEEEEESDIEADIDAIMMDAEGAMDASDLGEEEEEEDGCILAASSIESEDPTEGDIEMDDVEAFFHDEEERRVLTKRPIGSEEVTEKTPLRKKQKPSPLTEKDFFDF